MGTKGTKHVREAMTPYSTLAVPTVFGTIPSFLGATPIQDLGGIKNFDAVVAGLPWEGSNTWGGYSGCEQSPKACRGASMRLGSGYLPEHDIDVMSNLALGDLGDLPTFPNDVAKTHSAFEEVATRIFETNAVPILFGGDHSVTPPILKALSANHSGRIGILHFDAHFDNSDDYCGDKFARCTPFHRIPELPQIDPSKIVHFGIRGPRNSPSQMKYARETGIHIMTMTDIRKEGFAKALARAKDIISDETDGYYVTICSDVIDFAFNPGGPIDFGGVTASDMCEAVFDLGQGKMLGIDLVEVYPRLDAREVSVHLMTWLAIYALGGLAIRKKTSRH